MVSVPNIFLLEVKKCLVVALSSSSFFSYLNIESKIDKQTPTAYGKLEAPNYLWRGRDSCFVTSFRAFVVNFKADLSFYRKQKLILYTEWLYKNVVHRATSIIVMVIIYNKTKTEPCVCGDWVDSAWLPRDYFWSYWVVETKTCQSSRNTLQGIRRNSEETRAKLGPEGHWPWDTNTRQGDMQIRPDEGEPLSCAQCRQTTTCGLETSLSPVTQCPEEMLKSVALKVFSQPPFLYLPEKGGGGNRVYWWFNWLSIRITCWGLKHTLPAPHFISYFWDEKKNLHFNQAQVLLKSNQDSVWPPPSFIPVWTLHACCCVLLAVSYANKWE